MAGIWCSIFTIIFVVTVTYLRNSFQHVIFMPACRFHYKFIEFAVKQNRLECFEVGDWNSIKIYLSVLLILNTYTSYVMNLWVCYWWQIVNHSTLISLVLNPEFMLYSWCRSFPISGNTTVSHDSKDLFLVSMPPWHLFMILSLLCLLFTSFWLCNRADSWRIAGNNKSHWFEANNNSGIGYYPSGDACYTVAILCILRRLLVLPPIKQHLPPLFLPFTPSKPYIVANWLCRDHYHDHHNVFSSNLLHFSMWSTMALCLPWCNHSSRLVHHCNTAFTNLVNRQISCISIFTLFFHGALWLCPWNPCCNCQLV